MTEVVKSKIALYIPAMSGGGAEKVFMILANYFVFKGYKVDLLLTKKTGYYLKDLSEQVNIVELSTKRVLFDFFKLISYFKKNKPDVVVSALMHCNLLAIASSFFSGQNNKVYATEHTNFTQTLKEKKSYEKFLFSFLIKILYRKSDGVISVSNGVKEDLNHHFPFLNKKNKVIYNPFEIEFIKERSQESISHPWLQNTRDHKTIISVGRLTPAKDFNNLLSAFLILKDKINVRLIILGEGELKSELSDFIILNNLSNLVELHGFVGNPFSFISKSDAFVSSSKYEGLSNVLIESMICDVPLVSTDCPSGPAEILEGGRWGTLVPVGDSQALADAIYKTLNNKKSLDYSSRIKYFDKNKIGDEYLKYIL